jgi:hypothetical protein
MFKRKRMSIATVRDNYLLNNRHLAETPCFSLNTFFEVHAAFNPTTAADSLLAAELEFLKSLWGLGTKEE